MNTHVDGIFALMRASVGGFTAAIHMLLEMDTSSTAGHGNSLNPPMKAAEDGTVVILQLLTQAAQNDNCSGTCTCRCGMQK
jgi:hypothetical protein